MVDAIKALHTAVIAQQARATAVASHPSSDSKVWSECTSINDTPSCPVRVVPKPPPFSRNSHMHRHKISRSMYISLSHKRRTNARTFTFTFTFSLYIYLPLPLPSHSLTQSLTLTLTRTPTLPTPTHTHTTHAHRKRDLKWVSEQHHHQQCREHHRDDHLAANLHTSIQVWRSGYLCTRLLAQCVFTSHAFAVRLSERHRDLIEPKHSCILAAICEQNADGKSPRAASRQPLLSTGTCTSSTRASEGQGDDKRGYSML